jgi:hypothetical protein
VRRGSLLGTALLALILAGCATPVPSWQPAAPCTSDLPPRTSPTDYPVGVLYVGGDDLPPVVGEVEWLGGDSPVSHLPPRDVQLERFSVLQVEGLTDVSVRMTDGVRIAAWAIDAVPDNRFRSGDVESDRVRWSEGDEPTDVVCLPVQDGDWAIIADLTFTDDAGSGTYYWRLNINATPGT